MQVGEVWAYRERAAADLPLIPAEVLQFGPPRSQKVRIRWKGGEYEGLDEWIPRVRLRVLWSEAEAWLRDEKLFGAACDASQDALDSLEHRAAWEAVFIAADDLRIGFDRTEGGDPHTRRPRSHG